MTLDTESTIVKTVNFLFKGRSYRAFVREYEDLTQDVEVESLDLEDVPSDVQDWIEEILL